MRIDVADDVSPIAEHDDIAGEIESELADRVRTVLAGNCDQDVTSRFHHARHPPDGTQRRIDAGSTFDTAKRELVAERWGHRSHRVNFSLLKS